MSGEDILVVEDNKTTAAIMQLKLENLGYKVPSLARNADEAIQQAGRYHPALVLMDINLGRGADGIEAANIIKKKYKIPIVFVTRYSDESTLARAKDIHPLGYINKPLRDKDIRATIEIAMEQIRSRARSNVHVELEHEHSDHDIRIEILCDVQGSILEYDANIMQRTLKHLDIESAEELLPYNHYQLNSYCLRLDNSHLIAGRLLDNIFTWEYVPDKTTGTVRVICENITSKSRLMENHATEDAFKQTLNCLSVGVTLLNQRLQPTFINETARSLLQESSSLFIRNGRLCVEHEAMDYDLKKMIETAGTGKLTLGQAGSDQTIDLLISPLQTSLAERSDDAPVAIAFIFCGRKDREHLETVLERLYLLTKAEARLAAALVQDPRLEEAAASIGITVNTARTHLKKLFSKTGTDRQSSLVHHIVTGPAGILIKAGTL